MTDKISAIRAQLPAVQQSAFLNTGTCGPLPTVTADTVAEITAAEYAEGRASTTRFGLMMENKVAVRELFAQLFHVEPETIALTHHTTEGMNIASYGFNWQPGDEIITTNIEHEAGLYPIYILQDRFGVKIKFVDVGFGEDYASAIADAITDKTRLITISHVSYSSGAKAPLGEIVKVAHEKGVAVLADAAQSAGVFDVNLKELDVDFYAVPGQKWLCGPEGTGAFYVRPESLELLNPTFVGYFSFQDQDWQGGYDLQPGAMRFETGMQYPATIAGLKTSLEWFLNEVDPTWAYDRIASLAAYARQKLEVMDGLRIITPANRQASLVNFVPVGWSPARMSGLVAEMENRGFVIRSISHEPYCTRVSCGFYNTEAEIDGMCAALADILAAGPEAIEIPEMAIKFGLSDEPIF